MKRSYAIIIFFALAFLSFKKMEKHFFVKIYFDHMLYPPLVRYSINQDKIQVDVTYDRFRSHKTIYQKPLTAIQSNKIYTLLSSLKLDTLKSDYSNLIYYDGLYTTFKISGTNIPTKETTTYCRSTVATDSILNTIGKNILPAKFSYDSLCNKSWDELK